MSMDDLMASWLRHRHIAGNTVTGASAVAD
jgi:hypothetical protein